MKLAVGVRKYMTQMRVERGLAELTVEQYARELNRFVRFASNCQVAQVDDELLRAFLRELSRNGATGRTVAHYVSVARCFLQFMVNEGEIAANPALGIIGPKISPPLPRWLSVDEALRLVDAPDPRRKRGIRDRALLATMYGAGLRVGEVTELLVPRVDLDEGLVTVLGKGAKSRTVPIGDVARDRLRAYLEDVRSQFAPPKREQRVFISSQGGLTRCWVMYLVRKYAERAGLGKRVWPHMLRHSCATHMLDGGANIREIQEQLGHQFMTTTAVYTHVETTRSLRAYQRAHPRG